MESARWSKQGSLYSDGNYQNLSPNRTRFKAIQRYNSSNSLPSLPTRPCMYVWTYACFFAAIFFIFLAGTRPVADPKGDHRGGKGVNFFRLSTLAVPEDQSCEGRRVYMYELPPEFNIIAQDSTRCNRSLIPWMDICPRFRNEGFGADLHSSESSTRALDPEFDDSDWYDTDFYMLDVIFHSRMKRYRCLTQNASKADALYVPHYTGILALDYLYGSRPYEERKWFGKDLIDWLERNGGESWRRYAGKDHFLAMGRTTWDFRIGETWGTAFSELPHVANMTSLMIESSSRFSREQAIPYLTAFHPSSSKRLYRWIETVTNSKRRYLFSYVGAPRDDPSSVRGIMISSCNTAGKAVCSFVDCSVTSCSHDPVPAYKSFLRSHFCLQPRGDSHTRRSTFDCLISGAIPVFFHVSSAYTQYSWHLPRDPKSYSVFVDEEDLKRGVSIEHVLRSYSQETIEDMQKTIVSMIPNLLYFDCRKDGCSSMREMDAFDLTVEGLLAKVAHLKNHFSDS
ncbi:unnamed protein product [Calypogeia fissa]